MAKLRINLSGPGGSLGECVLCGKPFLLEVLTGKMVPVIGIDAFGDRDLPIHADCLKSLTAITKESKDWHSLPEGPLRRCYAEEFGEQVQP